MKLTLFVCAEFAATVPPDHKLVIAGIFNSVEVTRAPDVTAEQLTAVTLPGVYLAAVVEASISEGLVHTFGLRVQNEDEDPVQEDVQFGNMEFIINPHGRPMRFNAVIRMVGLQLPGAGDYTLHFLVDGEPIGDTKFYVNDVTDQM
jgi:hypothetical protein